MGVSSKILTHSKSTEQSNLPLLRGEGKETAMIGNSINHFKK